MSNGHWAVAVCEHRGRRDEAAPDSDTWRTEQKGAAHNPKCGTWPWVKIKIALSEHPNPTSKIGSKMGGEFTYPKMVPLVLTHSHMCTALAKQRTLHSLNSKYIGGKEGRLHHDARPANALPG